MKRLLIAFLSLFAVAVQAQQAEVTSDTLTRPSNTGRYRIGVINNIPYLIPKTGNAVRITTGAPTSGVAGVSSINTRTGAVTLTKTDVGLSNVPNTDATSRTNHTGTQSATTITGLSTVATSGAYTDLAGRPTLAPVATSGSAADLTGTLGSGRFGSGTIPVVSLSATGSASNSTYLRGDGTWGTPAGGTTNITGLTNLTSTAQFASLSEPAVAYDGFVWVRKSGSSQNSGTTFNGSGSVYYERQFTGPVRAEWFGAVGNNSTDCYAAFTAAVTEAVSRKVPVLFGPGTFRFNQTVYLQSNLVVIGAGQEATIFTFPSTFSGTQLFVANGISNLYVANLTVTGTGKELDSGFRINSYPNQCRNIVFEWVTFRNFYGDAVEFGAAGSGDPTHWNEDVFFRGCTFRQIGNPSLLFVINDTDPRHNGISFNQTTKRAFVSNCIFEEISGDGIFAWQYYWPSEVDQVSLDISNNFFTKCWMFIEFPSLGGANRSRIQNNTMLYPNRQFGYAISVTGDQTVITGNNITTIERPALEIMVARSVISNNNITLSAYKTGGLQSWSIAASNSTSYIISVIEMYGSGNDFRANKINIDPLYTSGTQNQMRVRTLQLVSRPSDTPFVGYSDLGSYNTIRDNYIYGGSGAFVHATVAAFRKTDISGNRFISPYLAEAAFIVQGYDWRISNNVIDLTNASTSGSLVDYNAGQSGTSRTIIRDNEVISTTWRFNANTNHTVYNTTYIDPSSGAATFSDRVLEEPTANLALYSEQFDNAAWNASSVTPTANVITAPNGSTTADMYTINVSGSASVKQWINVTAGTTYTFSFWVKRGTATNLKYSVYNWSGSAEIIPATDYYGQTSATEWRQIVVTFTAPAGCTQVAVYPTRDSTSTGTFYVWGGMLNPRPYASSYIPTTSAAVYR